MESRSFFHHPDISLPVVRRRASQHLIELVGVFGDALVTHGRSLTWNYTEPNRRSYFAAVRRLEEAGLIVASGRRRNGWPVLRLTESGKSRLPDECRPERLWRKRWNGIWYVLVYDIPESARSFRNTFRAFLGRSRLGCLQRSVWVTAHDIRPAYDDLTEAAGITACSYLFESKTVLGRRAEEIVETAWNFEKLWEVQSWFCEVYAEKLELIRSRELRPDELMAVADEELSAYLATMANDPLLPRQLWPSDYLGPQVYALHQKLVATLGAQL